MLRIAPLWALLVIAGCDPSAPADAGTDASLDAFVPRDVPRDIGPPCELSCGVIETCCVIEETPMCVNIVADVENCGGCGIDCIATGRGDHCLTRQCACGEFDIGCTGVTDECCPAVPGGRAAHCANVRTAREDCGACGNACVDGAASECRNGSCVCGDSDRACTGEPTDLCCPIGTAGGAYGCVDTLTDAEHCGDCDTYCGALERCDGGRCVSRFDAGSPDAGSPDAGSPDAGSSDAGTPPG